MYAYVFTSSVKKDAAWQQRVDQTTKTPFTRPKKIGTALPIIDV